MIHPYLQSFLGGAIVGVAASIFLVFNGRVAGICGVLGGLLQSWNQESSWRLSFVLGVVLSGVLVFATKPEMFVVLSDRSVLAMIMAGLLVGFGALMGNGCTSGHAVCGISRLSIRSIVATAVFMSFGIITATLYSFFFGMVK